MDYEIIVGLEVHVQLQTQSKLFCGCANKFNPDNPNVQTCPVCIGMPGSLPVMNRDAFRLAVKTALAINCNIASFTKWDRKQYYYPDLPKAYQISQYDLPFSSKGWLEIAVGDEGQTKRVGIIRAHLEEDAGKNMHDESGRGGDSRVDLNRTGTPLVEIVSEPELSSAIEARTYLEELKLLLSYLGVSDCNMQEGSLRCDANVNLKITTDDGETIATPIVEVKNLNSFRNVEAAIDFEVDRQLDEWKTTRQTINDVAKQTRGWDANRNVTFAQRGKEEAADYRYFPDPDLLPVTLTDVQIDEIRQTMCELPARRRERFQQEYALSPYDASVIIEQGESFADYFETVAKQSGDGKQAANWVTQDVLREMNERNLGIRDFPISAELLSNVLSRVLANEITIKSARVIFQQLMDVSESTQMTPENVDQIIADRNLAIVSDTGALDSTITAVIERNAKAVEDFKAGKQAAVGALIGQVMRDVKGADAKVVRQMLIDRLSS